MLLGSPRPSFGQGFARSKDESKHPSLWKGLVGGWAATLGITGTTLRDVTGFGNNGTFNGTPVWVPSEKGWAIDFEADDEADFINFGSGSKLDNIWAGGGGTFFLFFKPESAGELDNARWFDKGEDASAGWSLLNSSSGGQYLFTHSLTTTAGEWSNGTNTLSFGAWHTLSLSFDKVTEATPIWFQDGAAISVTTEQTPSGDADDDSGQTLYSGARGGSARWADGLLGIIYLYDYILPASAHIKLHQDPYAPLRSRPRLAVKAPAAAVADLIETPTVRSYAITRAASW